MHLFFFVQSFFIFIQNKILYRILMVYTMCCQNRIIVFFLNMYYTKRKRLFFFFFYDSPNPIFYHCNSTIVKVRVLLLLVCQLTVVLNLSVMFRIHISDTLSKLKKKKIDTSSFFMWWCWLLSGRKVWRHDMSLVIFYRIWIYKLVKKMWCIFTLTRLSWFFLLSHHLSKNNDELY